MDPSGRIVSDAGAARNGAGLATIAQCHAMAIQYASADNASAFRQLIERANRFNVSFYPFDTRGLGVFDRSIGVRGRSHPWRSRRAVGEGAQHARPAWN